MTLENGWFPADCAVRRPPVLLIHGGGWSSLEASSMHGVARWLQSKGFSVRTPNYRKVQEAPWPACLQDCLLAGRSLVQHTGGPIVAMGASAGGHLALMTALSMEAEQVAGVISVCGATRLGRGPSEAQPDLFSHEFLDVFFGHDGDHEQEIREAEPFAHLTNGLPDLLCVHSVNDHLVPPEDSWELLAAWRAAGNPGQAYSFAGEPPYHGIWANPEAARHQRRLRPDVERVLLHQLHALSSTLNPCPAACAGVDAGQTSVPQRRTRGCHNDG